MHICRPARKMGTSHGTRRMAFAAVPDPPPYASPFASPSHLRLPCSIADAVTDVALATHGGPQQSTPTHVLPSAPLLDGKMFARAVTGRHMKDDRRRRGRAQELSRVVRDECKSTSLSVLLNSYIGKSKVNKEVTEDVFAQFEGMGFISDLESTKPINYSSTRGSPAKLSSEDGCAFYPRSCLSAA